MVAVNQAVYLSMAGAGWEVVVVVPDRWRHEYAPGLFQPEALAGMEDALRPLRVLLPGRPQRHVYLARLRRILDEVRPDVVFLEQESFSLAALQWGAVAARAGVAFGVQSDENLDRPLPAPVRVIRTWVLRRAAFVAARSPRAEALATRWGARGATAVVPHAVPLWTAPLRRPSPTFTIGFAGRLVPEKGVADLVEAVRRLSGPVRLLFVGDGPLREEVRATVAPGVEIEVRTDLSHADMPDAYAEMDLLVLPSRTTDRWAEQFGRVLVEALSCGVPVVGSDSGEIPWVVNTTGGGLLFPEGDVAELARLLDELRADPVRRAELAERGAAVVRKVFTADGCAGAMEALLSRIVPAGRDRPAAPAS